VTLWQAWEEQAPAWTEWARRPGHDGFWEGAWPELAALLPPRPELVVEIGCGEGRVGRELQALGHRVVGVERSWTLVHAARHHQTPIAVVHGDAAGLPLGDRCVGTAVACMSLLDVDDLTSAVNEIGRVLRPGGCLCVALVHPFISAYDVDTVRTEHPVMKEPYLAERRYEDHEERDGLTMTFVSMHRPLNRYLTAFFAAGLVMDGFREFGANQIPWLAAMRLVRLGTVPV
jgi:SAM-dependent methyltransferase